MKDEVIRCPDAHPAGRVSITGRLAGVEACRLTADRDVIVVGSSLACDLPVPDPLLPPRAFRLRRQKCHAGTDKDCKCCWMLDVLGGARVYVNRSLARAARLAYGDVITAGCHEFAFERALSAHRNERLNKNVCDVYEKLFRFPPVPPGFLSGTPEALYRMRKRKALAVAGWISLIVCLLLLLTPRAEYFEAIQPPLEVTLFESPLVPPDAVRPLEQVARKSFETADQQPEMAEQRLLPEAFNGELLLTRQELAPSEPEKIKSELMSVDLPAPVSLGEGQPFEVSRVQEMLRAAAVAARRTVDEKQPDRESALAQYQPAINPAQPAAGFLSAQDDVLRAPDPVPVKPTAAAWNLPDTKPFALETGAKLQRAAERLAASAPARRLSVAEATQELLRADLRKNAPVDLPRPPLNVVPRPPDVNVAPAPAEPSAAKALADAGAQTLAAVMRFQPSPVEFEEFMDMRVPVARVAEQLQEIALKTDINPLQVDGKVTDAEMDASWKSGRFREHAPGNPPPESDPPTFCYIGKTTLDGKDFLYISFVCFDPNLNSLILNRHSASRDSGIYQGVSINQNDSVELFLDTNFNRRDYYQLIVDANGRYWKAYFPASPSDNPNVMAQPWNIEPVIKTAINKEAGQWVCEIMIPFDRIGGVPKSGSRWGVNMYRNFRGQVATGKLQSWFVVYDPSRRYNYHHPTKFGIFEW